MLLILIIVLILGLLLFFNKKGVPCIMYHNVSNEKGITPEEFEEQMMLLQKYKTFKLEELDRMGNKFPENTVLVTFDDGYADNYTNAFPLLKKYNIKATIFLNTAYINNDPFYMNWDQIREMYKSGLVDFQLHTHSHFTVVKRVEVQGFFEVGDKNKRELNREMKNIYRTNEVREGYPVFKKRGETAIRGYKVTDEFMNKYDELLGKYRDMDREKKEKILKEEIERNLKHFIVEYTEEEYNLRVENEIIKNQNFIKKNLGKDSDYFANPWGHKSKELLLILKKLGIKGMITTKKGTNYLKPNIYKIRRYETKSMKQFKKLLFINNNYIIGKIYELIS